MRVMRDVELYQHLLGLQVPWSVSRVDLDLKAQRVDVWAEHSHRKFPCPECGGKLPVYDHSEERTWRHLDSCQFMTFLHARIPRVKCEDHGVRQVAVAWAEPRARFTAMFERFALEVLRESSIRGATRILRISWDEAMHLMRKAVKRGLARKGARVVPRIGVDEKSAAKGHRYFTIVSDVDRGVVEYVALDRTSQSLDEYFRSLTPAQRSGIEAVALDMWDPFIFSLRKNLPDAEKKMVFDRFHIMVNLGKAVDTVRKNENRELLSLGHDTLKGSRQVWLYAAENLPSHHRDYFKAVMKLNLKTGRAWAMKETLRELWDYKRPVPARRHFERWYAWAIRSRLPPMERVARMMLERITGVMTYFRHRITNAVSEGLNSKIQTLKKRAYGFRNRENFRTAIYFHCGGLDTDPLKRTHAKA